MRSHRPFLTVAVPVLLLACSDVPDKFDKHLEEQARIAAEEQAKERSEDVEEAERAWIKAHTPEALARLAKFEAVAKAADAKPPVTAPEVITDPGEPIEMEPDQPGFNAGLVQPTDLLQPCAKHPRERPWVSAEGGGHLGLAAQPVEIMPWFEAGACLAMEKHPEFTPGDPVQMRGDYERLDQAKYAVVVRTHEIEDGKVLVQAKDGKDGKFQPGQMRGDVLVYRFEDAAYLLGFPVAATNSKEIAHAYSPDEGNLRADLQRNFESELNVAFRTHLPGFVNHRPLPDRPIE